MLREEGPGEFVLKVAQKLGLALSGRPLLVQPADAEPRDLDEQYGRWLARPRPPVPDRPASSRPVVSLLAALRAADGGALADTVASLRAQRHPGWELCLALPAALAAALKDTLETLVSSEPRLRPAASEGDEGELADALRVATGEVVGILEVPDVLHPDALLALAGLLADSAKLDVVYSDEDELDADGRRVAPFFKPDWSPDLLLGTSYVARLGLVRRARLEAVGGIRRGLGAGAAYDLWLRVAEQAAGIARVPRVLYHRRRRAAGGAEGEQEGQVLADALQRRGLAGVVEPLPVPAGSPPAFVPRLRVAGRPLVSIVIPTRDRLPLLAAAIRGVTERTAYDRCEVLVVDNESRDAATLRYLDSLQAPCRVLRAPGRFNFSALNNLAARHAAGDYLLLLNNDVDVREPGWLLAMLEHAQRPDVGAVGAKLLYPDGRIQHAGIVLGLGGLAGHGFRFRPEAPPGWPRLADLVRDCSAVTAACMMLRRAVFDEVGGFDERLRVSLNDVDLCLRIRRAGYRVVYTPRAVLTHHEGASRGRRHPTADARRFRARWAAALPPVDPFYHPELTDAREDWSLPD